jgi:hypothetical protein
MVADQRKCRTGWSSRGGTDQSAREWGGGLRVEVEARPHESRATDMRNGNRRGNSWIAPRCGARTRRGTATDQLQFDEGRFYAHDIVDFGFLDLVRLGVHVANDPNVSMSIAPRGSASDSNASVQYSPENQSSLCELA